MQHRCTSGPVSRWGEKFFAPTPNANLSPRTGGEGGWGRWQKCELDLLHISSCPPFPGLVGWVLASPLLVYRIASITEVRPP